MDNLWFAPIISIVLLFLTAFAGQTIYDMDRVSGVDAIKVTNLSSNIDLDYGYYSGEISGLLKVTNDFDHLTVKVDFYDSRGAKMNAAAYVISENNVKKDSTFNIKAFYSGKEKPAKAILTAYKELRPSHPIYTMEIKL